MRSLRALLGRGTRKPVSPSYDLQRDAADVAADRRPALPQRLGDGQPEALADRLLDADVGLRLEGVDLDRADVVEVVEDLDVGVAAGVARRSSGRTPSPRGRRSPSSRRARAGRPGISLVDDPVGVDHAASGPSRDRSARPGASAGGRGRCRTGSQTKAASSGESAMFFGESGSIAGGTMRTLAARRCRRARSRSHVPDAARRTRGSAGRISAERVGVRRREVDVAAPDPAASRVSGALWRRPTGWGSWTMITSQVALELLGVHPVVARRRSPTARRRGLRSPWSELCISFVTLKNSSRPRITCQCASRPTSRISGTSV